MFNLGQEDTDDDTTGNPDPTDHFQCHEIKPAAQDPLPLISESQFGPLGMALRFPHRLCARRQEPGRHPGSRAALAG